MSDNSTKNKGSFRVILVIVAVAIVGLGAGVAYILTTKHGPNTVSSEQASTRQTTATQPAADTSQYKLSACKSGTTQTIANANYLVGTDIAPGSFKIVSQPAGIGWTSIDIFATKADYDKSGDANRDAVDNSFDVTNSDDSAETPAPNYTKLTDGQYMVVSADPSTFTCE